MYHDKEWCHVSDSVGKRELRKQETTTNSVSRVHYNVSLKLDCSQSPIFSCDRGDVARLTVNDGHLDFQMYRGDQRRGL